MSQSIPTQPNSAKVPTEYLTESFIEEIKCKIMFTETDIPNLTDELVNNSNYLNELEQFEQVYSNLSNDISQIAVKLQTNLGKGTLFIPGWIRGRFSEILFQNFNDIDNPSIPESLIKSLVKIPIDLRKQLSSNCLIIGGTSSLPGLKTRLKNEVKDLLFKSKFIKRPLMDLSNLTDSFEIINDPNPSIINNDNNQKSNHTSKAPCWSPTLYSWVGGSLAG